MRIVVVGGSGNVGTAVLRRLAGDHQLVGVSRRTPQPVAPYRGVEWHELDLADEDCLDRLTAVLRGADAVVHAAWLVQPSHDEDAMRRTNIDGTDRVCAAVALAGVPHLVYLSSVGAYSPARKDRPATETWPTDGIGSSTYSRHKAAVEHLLDVVATHHPELVLTRLRPALIMQRAAASEIRRFFLGRLVPRPLLRLAAAGRLPVLPLPARLVLQFVHADDVAQAVDLAITARAGGAFNLAAEPTLGPAALAALVGARRLPLPERLLRTAATATWRARLQPTDAGWVDLALGVPVMDTARAREVLGWSPRHTATDAVRELLTGLGDGAGGDASPPLRP
jgi:UDP-glucose 4-epimerase